MKLDIGCGTRKREGFIGMDRVQLAGVDIVHNLTALPWPIDDDSCTAIHIDNFLEHLPDTVSTFNELFRIAKSGCRVETIYPFWRSFGGYADPTHVSFPMHT
jgi:predicted SAM-dependent methyltransferase